MHLIGFIIRRNHSDLLVQVVRQSKLYGVSKLSVRLHLQNVEDNARKFPGSVMPINLNGSVLHYRHSTGLVLGAFLLEAS